MGSLFNADFRDFLRMLWETEVRCLLVGGYSVILHGYSRTTGELAIWVERSADNYARLTKAFRQFGLPIFGMTSHNFLHNPAVDVFTFGRPPVAIDITMELKGLAFAEAYTNAVVRQVGDVTMRLIQYQQLLEAKRAARRPRAHDDIENLEQGKK